MSRTYVELGEWLPDLQDFTKPGLRRCFGVFPKASSYEPFNQLAAFSSNTLLQRCQGAIVAGFVNFAGDVSALYTMGTGTTYNSATRNALSGGAYSVLSTDSWQFAEFGNRIIAVNGHNNTTTSFTDHLVQTMSLNPATLPFANLTGVGQLGAKTIAVVRDFVVVGNIMHADSASGVYTNRVRWCGVNDPTTWTANATTMADHQDLVNGGIVMRIMGGEYGVVFMRNAVYRMDFVGSPLVFQFDQVQSNLGLVAKEAIAAYQNMIFFLSDTGFYAFDGATVTPIGRGKVDDAFWKGKLPEIAVNKSFLDRIVAEIDPENKLVLWSYPTTASLSGTSDAVLVYSWAYNRWSAIVGKNIERVTRHSSGTGAVVLAVFNNVHGLSRFTGSQDSALFTLAELQFNPKGLSTLVEARPYLETSGTAVSSVITTFVRSTLQGVFSAVATTTVDSKNVANMRATGRYHAVRMELPPGGTIHHIYGIEFEFQPHGWR